MVVGLVGSIALSRSIEAMLYDVSPLDPVTLGLAAILILAIALAAAAGPARRAASIDPVQALRAE